MLNKIIGMTLLFASIGVASCQALWAEAPGVQLMMGWMG